MKLGRKGPNLEEEGIIDLVDDGRRHLFDNPRNVKRVILGFFGLCMAVLLLDVLFFFEHKHLTIPEGQFELEGVFGFYGIYGFVACVLLVLLAKYVLRKLVMRDEDYYGR